MEQVKKPKFTRTCIACNNTFHEHGHKKCRTCRRLAQRGKNLEETTHANQDAPLPPPPPPPTPPPAPPLSRTSTVPGHEEFHATIWNILEEAKCKSGKFSKRATKGGFVEVDSKLSLHIPVENAATYTYSGPREVYDKLTSNHQRLVQEFIADCIPHAQQVVAELSGIPAASVKLSGFTFLFSFEGTAGQVPHIDASREDFPVFCAVGTEIIPTTMVYTAPTPTKAEVQRYLQCGDVWCTQMAHYAQLLQPRMSLESSLSPLNPDGWKPGDVTAMRGAVAHGGPSTSDKRAILFCVGTMEGAEATYNSENQWHTYSVIGKELKHAFQDKSAEQMAMKEAHMRAIFEWYPDPRVWKLPSWKNHELSARGFSTSFRQRFTKGTTEDVEPDGAPSIGNDAAVPTRSRRSTRRTASNGY